MQLLTGKVSIVTGASSGIGRATATLFAREGAHLVNHGTTEARTGSSRLPKTCAASARTSFQSRETSVTKPWQSSWFVPLSRALADSTYLQ